MPSTPLPPLIEDNEHWQEEIRSRFLTQEKYKKASPWLVYRKKAPWWRLCVRIANLPWIAILTTVCCCGLAAFVVLSILDSPANRQRNPFTMTVENGTAMVVQIITVECETDVTVQECEMRVKERAESSEFQRAMTETHLFITVIACWVGALVFFVTKAMRIRKRNRYLECLPHDSITVWPSSSSSTSDAIGSSPASPTSTSASFTDDQLQHLEQQQQQHAVVDLVLDLPVHYEMERAIILHKFLHTYDPHCSQAGDANWACGGGGSSSNAPAAAAAAAQRRKGTHFRTTVAGSTLHTLVDAAMQHDARQLALHGRTARQYVNCLLARFTPQQVSHDALHRVLALYEYARFGQGAVSESMFNEYGQCMYQLSMDFERLGQVPVGALVDDHDDNAQEEEEEEEERLPPPPPMAAADKDELFVSFDNLLAPAPSLPPPLPPPRPPIAVRSRQVRPGSF